MQLSPLAGLLASRKTILFVFVTVLVLVMCIALETVIAIAAIKGRMTIEAAIGLSFGPLVVGALGAVVMASKVIDAIAKEDAAAKTTGPIAVGGNLDITKGDPKP